VLVILQLQGGNDGLNMIIPRDQYPALLAPAPTSPCAKPVLA
jgi:uncharacterized protein (DUF1501 family)